MEFYRLSLKIILSLFLIKYTTGYVLNVEICLKLIYNLDWDFEGSLEKYHYCHALAQTLDGVEQVIYKMQIKDHMVDAWLDLVKKRGSDYSLSRLTTAKARGMVSEEAANAWRDVIKNRDSGLTEEENESSNTINHSDAKDENLISDEYSWLPLLLIGGAILYLAIGILIIIIHHIRVRKLREEECQAYLCDDAPSATKSYRGSSPK